MKFSMTKIAAGLVLAAAATGAQAVAVTSLTVVEVGGISGMTLSTATAASSVAAGTFTGETGGIFYFGAEAGNGTNALGSKVWGTTNAADTFFAATTDGQMTMGVTQGLGAISDGFRYGGSTATFSFAPSTTAGAPTGSWTGVDGAGQLSLNLAGFGGYWNASGITYNLSPDSGTLVTDVQTLAGVSYYTADWSHVITAAEDPDFAGQRADWHMEGVMAAVPEASTYGMMLAGLGLVGFAVRRRKLMA